MTFDPEDYVPYNDFYVPMLYYERALDRCIMSNDHYIWSGASCGGRLPQMGVKAVLPSGDIVSKIVSVNKLIWNRDIGHSTKMLYRICGEWLCVRPDHFEERETE